MLTLDYTTSTEMEKDIFGDTLPHGERVALSDDGAPCGVCVFRMENDSVIIDRIGILQGVRGRRYGDFFMRSLIYKFSLSHIDIIINGVVKYFEKFGFIERGGVMIAPSGEVTFPSTCGGTH